jgi:AraC-like DNA-binding protein
MSHLDRLSALLEGLAPQIHIRTGAQLAEGGPERLQLHLLLEGGWLLQHQNTAAEHLLAPALVVWRSDQLLSLTPLAAQGDTKILRLEAGFAGPAATLLLEAFAQPLVIALGAGCAELDLVVRLIASEMAVPRCGQPAMLESAGEILFVGLLRHLIAHPRTPSGMLNGLADPRIARALVAVHERPQVGWTLENLAAVAGMSRTAFALRFRMLMNVAPGAYLARLRLAIARREIARGNGLKRAARESGYASSTALSRALSRQAAVEVLGSV